MTDQRPENKGGENKFDKEGREKFELPGKTPGERFVNGFNYAFEGIIFAINNERNMRFHTIACILVLLVSLFFNVSRIEMIALVLAVCFVICSELFNTAIEKLVDLVTDGYYSKRAKVAKDVAAAATLVASLNAIFIAYMVFFDKVVNFRNSVFARITRRPSHLMVVSLSIVVLLTIFLKGILYKGHGTPFRGGAVSGHTALAFCLATIGILQSQDNLIRVIFLALALIVGESRFEADIHSIKEIILGAFLGTAITLIIFGVFG